MTATEAAARVRVGAGLLDEHEPGWEEWIVLELLDIRSHNHCVLGQLYHGYGNRPVELINGDRTDDGFTADDEDEAWMLTTAWTSLIRARRAALQPA